MITFFAHAREFRAWLGDQHAEVSELWVGFYRKDSGRGGLTYAEAVDEALCFGWIDGIKKRVDEWSYTHRFTPRRARSVWSLGNLKRVEELRKLGRMTPPGLKAFAARDPKRSGIYSFENAPRSLEGEYYRQLAAQGAACEFFQAQPPGYQRQACWWVMSAKKEETRQRRLLQLIADSANRRRLAVVSGKANTSQ